MVKVKATCPECGKEGTYDTEGGEIIIAEMLQAGVRIRKEVTCEHCGEKFMLIHPPED